MPIRPTTNHGLRRGADTLQVPADTVQLLQTAQSVIAAIAGESKV